MEIVKLFQAGGTFMYPILLVLALGLVIAIERFVYLLRTERATNSVWSELVPMLKALDFQRAVKLTSEIKTPIANVLNYGFSRHNDNKSREIIEAALEEGIMDEMPQLTQRTHYLATLANIATLLGLLGTIIGLIQAFTAVAQADPAEKADLLSASIAVAMNTTAFGLIAAIPLLLIHSFLITKTAHLVDNVEKSALKALNLMVRD
ncbi:MotA/TolQ/ExbB proton channel family protein [Colwellia psychrerythraea]|uniref:MotA/TolQ/ExbB proton channel n=1 Tax=Colwellia psychrerythraea TaxID=28229 RepID=A0A099KYT2_COLPS|nr:MotA/TolQ/ExbB proton channel family protein [Colwellia psychrerythraea]KGJ94803.1 MotA/TolQ/ExbB proton channel [Colwellia psychrerythraea]